jgi:hypothetical protein
MSRVLGTVLSVALALLAGPSSADSVPRARVRFLGSDPIGPLASVSHGALRTPHDRACRSWGAIGSRWKALDALGRVAGEVEVVQREYYDVSRCDELGVRVVRGNRGAGIYVDARAPYRAPTVSAWQPSLSDLQALQQLADVHQHTIRDLDPSQPVLMAKRSFFFEWGATRERFAAVGGRSLLVCAFRGGKWVVVREERPNRLQGTDRGYLPLAVTDMNGDGQPELVVHAREGGGEWYADETFSMHVDGTWRKVPAGIYGSTA